MSEDTLTPKHHKIDFQHFCEINCGFNHFKWNMRRQMKHSYTKQLLYVRMQVFVTNRLLLFSRIGFLNLVAVDLVVLLTYIICRC